MTVVRPATAGDLDDWRAMRCELWPDSAESHDHELHQYFDGESSDIEHAAVAESPSGHVIGFIELNIRNFAEGSRSAAVPYVEGWFVHKHFRRQGIGSALMNYAEDWAQQLGYQELASDTELDNAYSIALHNKLGFTETERVVCFLKRLQ